MALDGFIKGLKVVGKDRITYPGQKPESDPTETSVIGVEREGGVQSDHVHKEDFGAYIRKTNVFRDVFGRLYFEINKYGADQMLLVRMLKGIMPVSDVVYNNGKFLSYEMPFMSSSTETGKRHRQALTQAYDLVFSLVFNDDDHGMLADTNNLRELGSDHSLFDLHLFGESFWGPVNMANRISFFKPRYGLRKKEVRILCSGFLSKLRGMFDGENGFAHLSAIVDNVLKTSSVIPMTIVKAPGNGGGAKIKSFRDEVLRRVTKLEEIINKYDKR